MLKGNFGPGVGFYRPRLRRDLKVDAWHNSCSALVGSMIPSQSANSGGGWSFHTVRDGVKLGESLVSFPGCWGCICVEGCLTRGRGIILPGCGWTSTLSPWATLAAR